MLLFEGAFSTSSSTGANRRAEDEALPHSPTIYAPWCEFCISNRAREDVHQSVTPSSAGSVVSFDFGYVSRLEDEKDKLTVLFAHDQHTKMMHSVPTQQKGGRSLVYLCTELVRFILHLGHQAAILRCDDEPIALWLWQIQQGNHLGALVWHASSSLSQWGITKAMVLQR